MKNEGMGQSLDSTIPVSMLDAWAPGGVPNMAPANSGQPVQKDSLVLMDTHYHPTGSGTETDSKTHLGLMLSKTKPAFISRVILLGNFKDHNESQYGISDLLKQKGESAPEFMIPAGEKAHVEEMTWTWASLASGELKVYGMGTHMHYVGRDMRVTLVHKTPMAPEPKTECLIETPAWNFNWQRGYAYDGSMDELPSMREGDTLHIRCVFDNTMDNPYVLQALDDQGLRAPVDVPLGEDTLNEMCLAAIGIIYPNP